VKFSSLGLFDSFGKIQFLHNGKVFMVLKTRKTVFALKFDEDLTKVTDIKAIDLENEYGKIQAKIDERSLTLLTVKSDKKAAKIFVIEIDKFIISDMRDPAFNPKLVKHIYKCQLVSTDEFIVENLEHENKGHIHHFRFEDSFENRHDKKLTDVQNMLSTGAVQRIQKMIITDKAFYEFTLAAVPKTGKFELVALKRKLTTVGESEEEMKYVVLQDIEISGEITNLRSLELLEIEDNKFYESEAVVLRCFEIWQDQNFLTVLDFENGCSDDFLVKDCAVGDMLRVTDENLLIFFDKSSEFRNVLLK
jgi:hypothetical protein